MLRAGAIRTLLVSLALLGWAGTAQSIPPFEPFPFRVDMQFQWNVRLVTPQQLYGGHGAPWYAYFPYDSNASVAQKESYPHWPQPFPPQSEEPGEGKTSVSKYQPPASSSQVPSYWYQKNDSRPTRAFE